MDNKEQLGMAPMGEERMKTYYVSKQKMTFLQALVMADSEEEAEQILMMANEEDLEVEAVIENVNCCKIITNYISNTVPVLKQTKEGYEVI